MDMLMVDVTEINYRRRSVIFFGKAQPLLIAKAKRYL
jgi:hypothetical protein